MDCPECGAVESVTASPGTLPVCITCDWTGWEVVPFSFGSPEGAELTDAAADAMLDAEELSRPEGLRGMRHDDTSPEEFVAAGDGRLAPARPCEKHPAYNSDYCPRCGTAAVIGGRS